MIAMMNRIERLADELIRAGKSGSAASVRAADVVEAIAVAQRLLELGEAQWFRGQVRNWPKLTPTFYRIAESDRADAEQRLARFFEWVKTTQGLEDLAASPDAVIAVAQHHGIPTPFLDFTTDADVAGFFASVTEQQVEQGTESCIYCLNIARADRIWAAVRVLGPEHEVERLELNIPNLWRLEAQKGVFVWSSYADLNIPFPLDRITFPYQGPVAGPLVDEIYPKRESPLEARLREYFQIEQIKRGSRVMDLLRGSVSVTEMEDEPFIAKHFISEPAPHSSWAEAKIRPWLQLRRESWRNLAKARQHCFEVDPAQPRDLAAARFGDTVSVALATEPALRDAPVTWSIMPLVDSGRLDKPLATVIQHVWDEMARLPWSDKALASALTATMRWWLTAQRIAQETGFEYVQLARATAERLLERPIRIELGGQQNAHNWGWVDEADLLDAVRTDFPSLLRPESRDSILGHSFNTMMIARSPPLLFDFDQLSELFSSVIIPTQAVFYPDHPLFPTPARALIIGPE